jgi:hypothetical protein
MQAEDAMGNLYAAATNPAMLAVLYFLYIGSSASIKIQKGHAKLAVVLLEAGMVFLFLLMTVMDLNWMRIPPGAHLYRDAQVIPLTAAIIAPYWIALAFCLIYSAISIVEQFSSQSGARCPSLIRLIMFGVYFLSVAYLWWQAIPLLQLIRLDERHHWSPILFYPIPTCIWALYGMYRMARQFVRPTPDSPASPQA